MRERSRSAGPLPPEPPGQVAGVSVVGGEPYRRLGGLESLGRLMSGFQGQRELKVDVGPSRKQAGGGPEILDGKRRVPEHQVRPAAQEADLAVVGSEISRLVQPYQCLIGLVPGKLNRADVAAGLGMERVELKGPEVGGKGRVGLPHALQYQSTGEVGLRIMRFDLDGRFEALERGRGLPFRVFNCSKSDQGAHVVRVELQGSTKTGLGLVEPPLKLEDLA